MDGDAGTDHTEITACYINHVSPMKTSKNIKYFECTIQTRDDSIRAVCFSPEKKAPLDAFKSSRFPVKISKFRPDKKQDSKDIIIDKKTTITQTTVTPDFVPVEISSNSCTPISSLEKINIEQLVTVKGKVVNISGIKVISTLRGTKLKRQEASLVDPTGDIKVVLWEKDTDSLVEGKTYQLHNIRLKQNRGERYLNPPKSGECAITEITPFEERLPEVSSVPATTVQTTATIIGLQSVNKGYCCCSCRKQLSIPEGKLIIQCPHCKMTQKTAACSSQWFLKIFCTTSTQDQLLLAVFHPQLLALAETHLKEVNLNEATPEELSEKILEMKSLTLTYETCNNKVIDFN